MPQIVRRFSRRWSFKGNRISNVGDTRIIRVGGKPEDDPTQTKKKIKKSKENKIKSAKYTLVNFLPKNLFEQFRRIANAYFLVISAIALFIDSPVSPVTSLIPLVFVVTVTGAKQGYEDWLRHLADNAVNKAPVSVIRNGVEHDICCEEIRVGELVRVPRDCEIPCDMLLLASSDKDRCHVTTANLDGETNLKRLTVPKHLLSINVGQLVGKAVIECQQPIADLYNYFGRLELCDDNSTTVELTENNLLLRGSKLKNTEWVIGCAIYTGKETKLSLNSRITINKFSSSEKFINRFLGFYVFIMIFEVVICYFMKRYCDLYGKFKWDQQSFQSHKHVSDVLQDIFSFMLLYNYLIPISLYVTIEMHKLIGSLFMEWDNNLYCAKLQENVLINSSDLNEELGQVEYLFTDKTGTLTKNEMHFQACSIKGKAYIAYHGKLLPTNFGGHDQEDTQPLGIEEYTKDIDEFFSTIALCHTVQVATSAPNIRESNELLTNIDGEQDPLVIPEYQASSPDEKALLEACYKFGFQFINEEGDELELRTFGKWDRTSNSSINEPEATPIGDQVDGIQYKLEKFSRLETLEFTSDRKRMSVVVQDSKGQIRLLCKGAESAIFPLCTNDQNSELMSITEQHIHEFSKQGLRTLAIAAKTLTMQEYLELKETLKQARSVMTGRRQTMLITSYRQVEEGLSLLGATAVEDALQDDIEDTVVSLRRAGIKIWVLTGDKVETALNIAHSCGHISRESHHMMFLVDCRTEEACRALLRQYANDLARNHGADFNLVVDGMSLAHLLKSASEEFRNVATQCFSVLCCRLSPMQKCQLVQLLKLSKSAPITCAIGDGANDVSMIQEAHIGLGIFGKEGRQAARCADLAFSEFRMLKRILLVHGHWYYQRLSTLVQYFFYKNLVFMNIQMLFQISCMFSTQSVYDSTFLTLYNVIYTAFPILILSLTEQRISDKLLLSNPSLYKKNRRNLLLRWPRFLLWTFLGTWHSLVIYIPTYALWSNNTAILLEGRTGNLWCFGTTLFHCVILVTNFKLWLYSKFQTYLFIASIILSNATFMIFNVIYSLVYIQIDGDMFGVYNQLLTSPSFWMLSVFIVVTCLIPDYFISACKEMFRRKTRHRTICEDDDVRSYDEVVQTSIL